MVVAKESTAHVRRAGPGDLCPGTRRRSVCLALVFWAGLFTCRPAAAQTDSGRVTVAVRGEHRALTDVAVGGGRTMVRTDRSGRAVLTLPTGPSLLTVARVGFRPETLRVLVRPALDTVITVELVEQAEALTPLVVSATRVPHQMEDEPTRVEVLGGEEIGEKTQTQPGNLTRLLEEVSGVRVQTASPPTGAASLRIQGLPGQYTAVLTDGLPLWSPQFGGLGLAQVPPLDLRQAEVIKGPATALYGPSALGGVVNLVSRPPGDEQELVLNQTSQSGSDGLGWFSKRLSDRVGLTVLGGVHRQSEQDLDGEGWADIPGYDRAEFRPRLYWNSGTGSSVLATVGGVTEHRTGGSVSGVTLSDSTPYPSAVNTNRLDGGMVGVFPVRHDTLTIRASGTNQWERDDFGSTSYFSTQHGRHTTLFSEATLTIPEGRATWLVGTGFEHDGFQSPEVPGFDYSYSTPGVFAQLTMPIGSHVAFTASGRCDFQNRYGTFCDPRLSALWRAPGGWTVRLSGATGFFAPTPFIDETQGIPFARLVPFGTTNIVTCNPNNCVGTSGTGAYVTVPFGLQAERVQYGALDVTKRAGPLNVTGTLFSSTLDHPLILQPQATILLDQPQLVNASGPTETVGGEVFAVYSAEPFVVLLEYAYVHSTAISPVTGARIDAPLVPRHSGGLDVAWESDESGTRVALDVFYTGTQPVLEDPYRTMTVPYTTIDLLVSQRVGREQVYISGENLGNVRQTQWDPLLLRGPGDEYRWTTSVWAPLAGRVINAGVRVGF